MANIRSLSDLNKEQKGRGPPGGNPPGGFPGGMFGGNAEPEEHSGNIKFLHRDGDLQKELRNAGSKLVLIFLLIRLIIRW